MNTLLHHLNNAQQQAVSAPLCNLMILAGAGSGKTRVLVHRIAWLLQQEQASPFSILAVTFTNKAAHEMRTRVEGLLGGSVNAMWLGTFHGLAHRLLRTHWRDAGLSENFQILDSGDQQRLVRRVMRDLNIDEERYPYKQVQWFINQKKDEGKRPHEIPIDRHSHDAMFIRIYDAYEAACAQTGVVDFAELLLRAYELWQQHPELLTHYRQRFRHVLVDEFQDINGIQYAWLRLLMSDDNFFTVVGDDDQLIYSWRGACSDNLKKFKKEFRDVKTITLDQNYRSTSTILNAANALISFNRDRFGKQLWTDGEVGEHIRVYSAYNEIDEARFIADECSAWARRGGSLNDVAILYRSNAQSRVLEEALLQSNIAYRIYGGLRFFERAEIKDALAYLRLCFNRFDDASFERVVNFPPRGIGNKTLETLRDFAKENNLSLWQAASEYQRLTLPPRATSSLQSFVELINKLAQETNNLTLAEITENVIQQSTLIEHYQKEKGETGRARIENLRELISAAGEFNYDDLSQEEKQVLTPMTAFLAHASLEAGEHQAEENTQSVKLMTLHAAKGLEFPFVILCGMEEGLFPHQMSKNDPKGLEEERRLCYVGMTRAMQQLLLTHAESRRVYGQTNIAAPSRFLREIPHEFMQSIRMQSKISRPVSFTQRTILQENEPSINFRLGQHVKHATFGSGVILDIEPNGEKTRVHIRFGSGDKWLIASLANLQPIH